MNHKDTKNRKLSSSIKNRLASKRSLSKRKWEKPNREFNRWTALNKQIYRLSRISGSREQQSNIQYGLQIGGWEFRRIQ